MGCPLIRVFTVYSKGLLEGKRNFNKNLCFKIMCAKCIKKNSHLLGHRVFQQHQCMSHSRYSNHVHEDYLCLLYHSQKSEFIKDN